ncbi:MAG TPA: PilN domain-containing protein, partial [Tepidisphaeraceae bacterium]|nr:PilN domain-containing protein [Tepidisphaeraceae bacterium]
MTQQAVNFLPEDYVEKRTAQRSAMLFIAMFLLVMIGIGVAYMMARQQLLVDQAQNELINKEYEDAAKRVAQLQELEHEKQRMMTKAEVTAVLLERVQRSKLIEEMTRLMPKGTSWLSLDLKTKESTPVRPVAKTDDGKPAGFEPTHAQPKDVIVDLVGMAPTDNQVAAFIAALGKSELLIDVNLLYTEEYKHNDQMLRRFRVEMKINPNADTRIKTAKAPHWSIPKPSPKSSPPSKNPW